MPVLVACSCGKQLRVPDEVVGRNIRCPVCKAVMLATPSSPPTIPITALATSDTDAAMIRFTCGACGKEMQALAEYGGQETACPECNGPVIIPGRAAVVSAPPPMPAPSSGVTIPDLPAAKEPPSLRRLRPARRRRLWVWVVAAVLLSIAGGLGVWYFFFRSETASDLALIPPDAQGFISIRAAEVLQGDALLRIRNTFPEFREELDSRGGEFGLKIGECERFTLVFNDVESVLRAGAREPAGEWWLICLASHPLDKKKLLEKLVPSSRDEKYQNKTLHMSGREDVKRALYFHTERIFVFGPTEGVRACLDHLSSSRSSGPLKTAIDEVSKHPFVAALTAAALAKLRSHLPDLGKPVAALLDAQNLTLTGDVNPSLELELSLVFADIDKAGAARTAADDLKNLALKKLTQFKQALAIRQRPDEKENLDALDQALNATRMEQKKETVLIHLSSEAPDRVLLKSVEMTRAAVAQAEIEKKLDKLAAALRAFANDRQNTKHQFPPAATYGMDGKPLLSWRVLLLPYLGEKELYEQFNLKADWNNGQNREAAKNMPAVYRLPDQAEAFWNMTYFQVFTGLDAPFDKKRQLAEKDFNGGLAKTIAIAVAKTPVMWSQPTDIAYDPKSFKPDVLGRVMSPIFQVVMFDGSVHTYPRSPELNQLKDLISYKSKKQLVP